MATKAAKKVDTKAISKITPKELATTKPVKAIEKIATQQEATESIKGLMAMMKGSRATWEAPLVALQANPTLETLEAFRAAVGKDQIKKLREHTAAFVKGIGKFVTPENVLAELPEDIAALMYNSGWPTLKADELSVVAKKYVSDFAPLYKAFSHGGVFRGENKRLTGPFNACKIGWAIIKGF